MHNATYLKQMVEQLENEVNEIIRKAHGIARLHGYRGSFEDFRDTVFPSGSTTAKSKDSEWLRNTLEQVAVKDAERDYFGAWTGQSKFPDREYLCKWAFPQIGSHNRKEHLDAAINDISAPWGHAPELPTMTLAELTARLNDLSLPMESVSEIINWVQSQLTHPDQEFVFYPKSVAEIGPEVDGKVSTEIKFRIEPVKESEQAA